MVALEFVGLLAIIALAAALLSHGAEVLAEKYGANFAGSILLGLITTLPEYMFVIWACAKEQYGVALGSAVGACTLLVTLGYGSVILFATTRFSRRPVQAVQLSQSTRIDSVYLLVTALGALLLAWEGHGLDTKDGLVLIAMFGAYVYHVARGAKHFSDRATDPPPTARLLLAGLALVGGGAIVFLFSEPFVDSMLRLAEALGISAVAIALVLGPIASEMPEKITAYITVRRDGRLAEISVCNFIGSKVNHNSLLLAMLPMVALFKGHPAVEGVVNAPFLLITGLTAVAAVSLYRRQLDRWQGWVFVALYLALIGVAYALRSPIAGVPTETPSAPVAADSAAYAPDAL
jgi:cation:H+ antiporter